MLIDTAALPQMAFYGDKYDAGRFQPVATPYGRKLKPNWGFWASPLIDNDTSEWTRWCEQERFKMPHSSPMLQNVTINKDADIFVVDTVEDAVYLEKKYEWKWEDMANDFDGVYVTEEGYWILRDGAWDMPSIVFFNTDSFTVN
jgi:hypothetical protein